MPSKATIQSIERAANDNSPGLLAREFPRTVAELSPLTARPRLDSREISDDCGGTFIAHLTGEGVRQAGGGGRASSGVWKEVAYESEGSDDAKSEGDLAYREFG